MTDASFLTLAFITSSLCHDTTGIKAAVDTGASVTMANSFSDAGLKSVFVNISDSTLHTRELQAAGLYN